MAAVSPTDDATGALPASTQARGNAERPSAMLSTLPAARCPLTPKLSSRTVGLFRGANKVQRSMDTMTAGVRNAKLEPEL